MTESETGLARIIELTEVPSNISSCEERVVFNPFTHPEQVYLQTKEVMYLFSFLA